MYKFFAPIILTTATSVLSVPIQVRITNLDAQKGNLNIAVFDQKTKDYFPNGAKATLKIVKKVKGSLDPILRKKLPTTQFFVTLVPTKSVGHG